MYLESSEITQRAGGQSEKVREVVVGLRSSWAGWLRGGGQGVWQKFFEASREFEDDAKMPEACSSLFT
jgi:hypothetical protein